MPMTQIIIAALCFLAALACGFMGYRLQKVMIALAVFAAGFVLFQRIAAQYLPYEGAATGVAIVSALIAAALSYHLYLAGIFLAFVIVAVSVARTWITNEWLALFAGIIVGCVLGALAVRMNRPIVICVTGIVGGYATAFYCIRLLTLLLSLSVPSDAVLWVSGTIFAVLGVVTQFRTTQEIVGV